MTTTRTIHRITRGTYKVGGFATADRKGYEEREKPWIDAQVRLLVEGSAWSPGFHIGAVDADQWYNLGPDRGTAQGPDAYAYGIPGVIDNYGGTGRELSEARAAGLLLTVKPGDLLDIDGNLWRVDFSRWGGREDRHNIELSLVDDAEFYRCHSTSCPADRRGPFSSVARSIEHEHSFHNGAQTCWTPADILASESGSRSATGVTGAQ